MRKTLLLFIAVQMLGLGASAQQASKQTILLPCTTENREASQPWVNNSRILDSYPKDNPVPRFIGSFRDKNQRYMLGLYRDAIGIFGEFSSPVLDADSPTSRLYDVAFDTRTGSLQFAAKFSDGRLQFSGALQGLVIKATVTRNKQTETVTFRKVRDSANDEMFFTSRAQFDCAMKLWNRF